jgi:hypothetical protein
MTQRFHEAMVEKTKILDQATRDELGEPKKIRVYRDGDLDLTFKGWRVGWALTSRYTNNRGTEIRIWITEAGKIITGAYGWSQWQNEGESYRAEVHAYPAEALVWLREDSNTGDYLGPLSKEAWEEACKAVPSLEGLDVEMVA